MNVYYFQDGGFGDMDKDKARQFDALTIGAALFHAKDTKCNDEWLASFNIGGSKFDLSAGFCISPGNEAVQQSIKIYREITLCSQSHSLRHLKWNHLRLVLQ